MHAVNTGNRPPNGGQGRGWERTVVVLWRERRVVNDGHTKVMGVGCSVGCRVCSSNVIPRTGYVVEASFICSQAWWGKFRGPPLVFCTSLPPEMMPWVYGVWEPPTRLWWRLARLEFAGCLPEPRGCSWCRNEECKVVHNTDLPRMLGMRGANWDTHAHAGTWATRTEHAHAQCTLLSLHVGIGGPSQSVSVPHRFSSFKS